MGRRDAYPDAMARGGTLESAARPFRRRGLAGTCERRRNALLGSSTEC